MYAGRYATDEPDKPCLIMASSGESLTYSQFEGRANQLAHLLRDHGLARLDHYAIFMENNLEYAETCAAGERAGLYYTCINSYLTAEELAVIVNDCEAKVLISSAARRDVALAALEQCPNVTLHLMVDATEEDKPFVDYNEAISSYPIQPIADEQLGTAMLYSSGTTGRPKGILRPLPENPPGENLPIFDFLHKLFEYR